MVTCSRYVLMTCAVLGFWWPALPWYHVVVVMIARVA